MATEGEGFMFTKNGRVQFYSDPKVGKLMLHASSRAAAKEALKHKNLKGCSIAEIGTVDAGGNRETLAIQVAAAANEGAVGMMMTSDGKNWTYTLFPKEWQGAGG